MAQSVARDPEHAPPVLQALRSGAFRLTLAFMLIVVGVAEFVVRRGDIGTACIVAGLALVGMALDDRYGPPPDEQGRA